MLYRIVAGSEIVNWVQFSLLVRANERNLLKRLAEFPDSVLITGCQRSGTTMLSKIIVESEGMVNYWMGQFRTELYGALILAGAVPYAARGRHCFQTTYVYDCPDEYFTCSETHKLIWMLRNPFSVIRSMLFNWDVHFSLNELFDACGAPLLSDSERALYDQYGPSCFSLIQRACLSYNGKVLQGLDLVEKLDADRLMVVDYDGLVRNKQEVLPAIYEFTGLSYRSDYGEKIHPQSLNKKENLSPEDTAWIESRCAPVYERVKKATQRWQPFCC